MAKGFLKFDLNDPDDRLEFKRATKATDAYIAFFDVAQRVFRPARKHGYVDPEISKLLESCGKTPDDYNAGVELVGKLEELYYQILNEYGINTDEDLQ